MLLSNATVHVHETARTVHATCPNCSNQVDFRLLWNKAGPGLGVPILMLFSDKFTVTTHKQYHLACPVCGYAERISTDMAKGLIAEGKP